MPRVKARLMHKGTGRLRRPADMEVFKLLKDKYPRAVNRALYEEFSLPVFRSAQENIPVWTAESHNSGEIRADNEKHSQEIVWTDPTADLIHKGRAGPTNDGRHLSGTKDFLRMAWQLWINGIGERMARAMKNARRRRRFRLDPPELTKLPPRPGVANR